MAQCSTCTDGRKFPVRDVGLKTPTPGEIGLSGLRAGLYILPVIAVSIESDFFSKGLWASLTPPTAEWRP